MTCSRRPTPAPVSAEMATAGEPACSGELPKPAAEGLEVGGLAFRYPVHLVQHQDLGNLRGADFRQHAQHLGGIFGRRGSGDIHQVQHQRGFLDLFQGGAERLHEGSGQAANEA